VDHVGIDVATESRRFIECPGTHGDIHGTGPLSDIEGKHVRSGACRTLVDANQAGWSLRVRDQRSIPFVPAGEQREDGEEYNKAFDPHGLQRKGFKVGNV
jgi:hypothetical protein